jgi:hypothetical protein
VAESLILTPADVHALADLLATHVAERLGPALASRQRRLVDRTTMSNLVDIGTATLDRLVAAGRVPSVLVGKRRLFDPDAVISALAQVGGGTDGETM